MSLQQTISRLIDSYISKYDAAYWQQKLSVYESWWAGSLGRPLLHFSNPRTDLAYDEGLIPYQRFWTYHPDGTTIDSMIIAMLYDLDAMRCYGDGFPQRFPQFGAGVLAAMLGAVSKNVSGSVWFEPEDRVPLKDRAFALDPQNHWFVLLRQIYTRLAEILPKGLFQVGMTDIGGTADILNSFSPGGMLLLDFYDEPEVVRQQIWRVHEAWKRVFSEYAAIINEITPGYTCWTPLLSKKSYYMLQCDLAYMIGPEMFEKFILDELKAACDLLERPFYHLDGTGQLAHLDMLLDIEKLQGIQWIPGEGSAPLSEWPGVFRKIAAAGKKIQVFLDPDSDPYVLDTIADQVGRADIICAVWRDPYVNQTAVDGILRRFC